MCVCVWVCVLVSRLYGICTKRRRRWQREQHEKRGSTPARVRTSYRTEHHNWTKREQRARRSLAQSLRALRYRWGATLPTDGARVAGRRHCECEREARRSCVCIWQLAVLATARCCCPCVCVSLVHFPILFCCGFGFSLCVVLLACRRRRSVGRGVRVCVCVITRRRRLWATILDSFSIWRPVPLWRLDYTMLSLHWRGHRLGAEWRHLMWIRCVWIWRAWESVCVRTHRRNEGGAESLFWRTRRTPNCYMSGSRSRSIGLDDCCRSAYPQKRNYNIIVVI